MHRSEKDTKAGAYKNAGAHLDFESCSANDIRVALVKSSYKPKDTHEFFSDVLAHEVTGAGYSHGGKKLTGKIVSSVGDRRLLEFRAANVVWSDSTITGARYAVIYDRTPGTDATRPLISYIDFGVDVHSDDGAFRINWSANGILSARRN